MGTRISNLTRSQFRIPGSGFSSDSDCAFLRTGILLARVIHERTMAVSSESTWAAQGLRIRMPRGDATVSPWRICPDVTESFIGCDQETPFGLDGLPHTSILCAAHSLPHNGLDAMACAPKKLCHL